MPDHSRRTAGRPRRPDASIRVHTLRVSVSDLELAAIRDRARSRGLRMGPYLRRAAVIGSAEVDQLLVTLARLQLELRGLAGNVNQHSHRANLLVAEARGAGRTIDLDAVGEEQRAMAGLTDELARTAGAVREAVADITGRAER